MHLGKERLTWAVRFSFVSHIRDTHTHTPAIGASPSSVNIWVSYDGQIYAGTATYTECPMRGTPPLSLNTVIFVSTPASRRNANIGVGTMAGRVGITDKTEV